MMGHLMQFLPLRFTILEAGLQVNDIYISMLPGGLWVQLLEDGGRGGKPTKNACNSPFAAVLGLRAEPE